MSTTEVNNKGSNDDCVIIDKIYDALRNNYIDADIAALIQEKFKTPFALSATNTNIMSTTTGTSSINTTTNSSATQPSTVQLTPQGVPLAQPLAMQPARTSLLQTAIDWTESDNANTLLNRNDGALNTNISNTHIALVLLEMLMKCDSGTYNGDLLCSVNPEETNHTTVEVNVQNDNDTNNNIRKEEVANLHATLAPIVMSMTNNIVEYLNKKLQTGSPGAEDIVATLYSYNVPVSLLRSGVEKNTSVIAKNKDKVNENTIEFDELGSDDNNYHGNDEDEDNNSYMNWAANGSSDGYSNPSDNILFDNEETQSNATRKRRNRSEKRENPLLLASQCLFLITRHFQLTADSVMDIVKLESKILERVIQESNILSGYDNMGASMKYSNNVNSTCTQNNVSSMLPDSHHTATIKQSALPWYYYHNRPSLVSLYKYKNNAQLLSLL